jgi:hypothetical protein
LLSFVALYDSLVSPVLAAKMDTKYPRDPQSPLFSASPGYKVSFSTTLWKNNLEILSDQTKQDNLYELGQWMGRKQDFSLIAGKTTTADVECLRRIRDGKLYRAKEVDWTGFCKEHVGVTRAYADRLIRQLVEFGPNYFHLSQVMRISADTYREIAPAVSDAGIAFDGETIVISPENSGKIVEAVNALRADTSPKRPVRSIAGVRKRLDAALADLNRIYDNEPSEADREDLADAVCEGLRDLTLLSLALRMDG